MSKIVVFIHGAWLTPASWDLFRDRFEAHGFETLAPAWPLEDVPIEQLRTTTDPALGKMTIGAIVDHYERIIRSLGRPPIIIGHSFGGLFTQMLLDRGLGAAGVAIDPVNFRGVLPSLRTIGAAMPVFAHWGNWNKMATLPFEKFASDFAQTVPEPEQRAMYERYIVPTPGRIFYQVAVGAGAKVRTRDVSRAPLLMVAGEQDRTITPSVVQGAYRKQLRSGSITEYRGFPERSHFLIVEPGWQEVCDFVMNWSLTHAQPDATTSYRQVEIIEEGPLVH